MSINFLQPVTSVLDISKQSWSSSEDNLALRPAASGRKGHGGHFKRAAGRQTVCQRNFGGGKFRKAVDIRPWNVWCPQQLAASKAER
ncbi:hypothetical protein N7461_003035 [Penicillium sp. DV-2018c]|nr:hypothetical protein N7461_003035 [Penicillium sp. DV-2018c]